MHNSLEDRTRFRRWIQRQRALINHPINVPPLSILGQKLKRGNSFPAPGLKPTTLPPPGGPPEIPSHGGGGPNVDGSPSSNNGSPPDNGGSESSSSNNPPPENSGPGNTGSGTQSSSGSSGFDSTPVTNTSDSSSTASGKSDTGSPTSSSTLSYSTSAIGSLVSSTPGSVSVDGDGNPSTVSVISNQGIKTGTITGIVVVVVLFLGGIIVFLLRKRNMAKRSKRRNKWLAHGNTPILNPLPSSDVLSVRSSFASPDFGNGMRSAPQIYHHDAGPNIPAQMAQITPLPVATVAEHVNRGSVYSIDSDTSHSNHSNHVHFTPSSAITEPPTISVRPFISSETWSFPQPPTNSPAPPRIPGDLVPDPASVETILRSFMPSMPDELAVISGDFVRIMKTFDDGWALIEKFESTGNSVSGLIPIDCLRPAGERLSSFITSKRVSSYGDTLGAPKLP